jgi:hypothetical protein
VLEAPTLLFQLYTPFDSNLPKCLLLLTILAPAS